MKTISISFLLFILGANLALAKDGGWDTGNGGFLSACKKSAKSDEYKTLEAWDFYEARKADSKNYEVAREWSLTVYTQVSNAIDLIAKVNPEYAAIVKSEFEFMIQPSPGVDFVDAKGKDLLEELSNKDFEGGWLQLVQGPLSPTDDRESYLEKGANCEKLQLVNYPDYIDHKQDPRLLGLDQKIKIDSGLWGLHKAGLFGNGYLLHKTDKAAILLHEAIYKVERDYFNASDSQHTRKIVSLLFQKSILNLDVLLRAELLPMDQKIFDTQHFDFESVRRFFRQSGKFAAVKVADLTSSQWDMFGMVTRDGRNLLDDHYTPDRANEAFDKGVRPRIVFLKDNSQVYFNHLFVDEICSSDNIENRLINGCFGIFRTSLSEGTLGFGQQQDAQVQINYQFPSVTCKLTYSRKVLICESLAKNGESFFTLFYKNPRPAITAKSMLDLRGAYQLVSEYTPFSNILSLASKKIEIPLPTIILSEIGAQIESLMLLGQGLGIVHEEGPFAFQAHSEHGNIVGEKLNIQLPFVNNSYLSCQSNSSGELLICSYNVGEQVTSIELAFERYKN